MTSIGHPGSDTLVTGGDSATITFIEFSDPPWQSGDYTVGATQTVSSSSSTNGFPAESFTGSLTFGVYGPRFSLPPNRVHTLFPPSNGNGDYAGVLPHIVLTDQTLPWQREPGAAPAGGNPATPSGESGTVQTPWLALLLFDQNDPAPKVTAGTVRDLVSPGDSAIITYPLTSQTLEYGDQTAAGYAPINYIDIPVDLFSAIAPSYSDLYWLSHARSIADGQAKAIAAGSPPNRNFSVVVANRLPTPGDTSLCCLVSLENMGPQLPPAQLPSGGTVRLAVLASWSFGCVAEPESFDAYFARLNKTPVTLQVPPPRASSSLGGDDIAKAFAMGYTAFNHTTRQGAATVSWYRGPFLPYQNASVLRAPFAAADALLRYDPDKGMFDTSYASAWQLGQLLALSDKPFATALYNWKIGRTQSAVAAEEMKILGDRLGIPLSPYGVGPSVTSQLMTSAIKPLLTAFVRKGALK